MKYQSIYQLLPVRLPALQVLLRTPNMYQGNQLPGDYKDTEWLGRPVGTGGCGSLESGFKKRRESNA